MTPAPMSTAKGRAITLLIIFETQGDTRHSRINVFFDVSIAKFYVVCLLCEWSGSILVMSIKARRLTAALLNAKINLKRDMEASVDQDDSFVRAYTAPTHTSNQHAWPELTPSSASKATK